MEIWGYIASALIGISLGLIGGGGSILTVPVMVYLFGINPVLSTSYSLFVVGSTSLVGALNNYRKGLVRIRTALLFGISSITTVFVTRRWIIPHVPDELFSVKGVHITQGVMTMVLFAILMVIAAFSMIRNSRMELAKSVPSDAHAHVNLAKLLAYGIGIGLATGLLGAGGGFLLIPTLVLLVKLSMKEAIGTSLFIIALNSLIGFTGDIGHFTIDWGFLFKVTAIATAGIFVGSRISRRISGNGLKKGFGWFVLVMGIYIIVRELFFRG